LARNLLSFCYGRFARTYESRTVKIYAIINAVFAKGMPSEAALCGLFTCERVNCSTNTEKSVSWI